MQLSAYIDASSEELNFLVKNVRTVSVFFTTTGRNAWHSTWVKRYAPGCMHTTYESARSYCERRRVQGTVFYVSELPSLAFITSTSALIVSEINSDSLLSRLDRPRLRQVVETIPVSTLTLDQVHYLFRPSSPLWPHDYPQQNSAILSYCSDLTALSAHTTTSSVIATESFSLGPLYKLDWRDVPTTTDHSAVHQLAQMLKTRWVWL